MSVYPPFINNVYIRFAGTEVPDMENMIGKCSKTRFSDFPQFFPGQLDSLIDIAKTEFSRLLKFPDFWRFFLGNMLRMLFADKCRLACHSEITVSLKIPWIANLGKFLKSQSKYSCFCENSGNSGTGNPEIDIAIRYIKYG